MPIVTCAVSPAPSTITGQSSLTKADGEARLSKPYRSDDVIRALKIVEEIVSTGQTSERVCHVWLVRAQLLTKLGKSGWGGHSSLPGVEGLAPQACDGCPAVNQMMVDVDVAVSG